MSPRSLLQEARKLPTAQRILLVEKIWDSIAEEQAELPLSATQKRQIEQRMAENAADPSRGESWEIVRKRIKSNIRRSK